VTFRYVIAMGLFFGESYDEVMRRLVGNLRKLGSWDDGWQVPTKSAITQARQRLDESRDLSTRPPNAGKGCGNDQFVWHAVLLTVVQSRVKLVVEE
jgi:hypothetical protein